MTSPTNQDFYQTGIGGKPVNNFLVQTTELINLIYSYVYQLPAYRHSESFPQ